MGVEAGLTRYECDRCGIKQFITIEQAQEEKWGQPRFLRANQSEVQVTLCASCLTDWNKIMPRTDIIFDNFMTKKIGE